MQPTALVHEVYLRLMNGGTPPWQGRKHFLAVAARLMRQTLIDHVRWGHALKRGGHHIHLAMEEAVALAKESSVDLLALDEALEKLGHLDSRKAEVIELRFFGSLTIVETAEALGISPTTVAAEWHAARAWLRKELEEP